MRHMFLFQAIAFILSMACSGNKFQDVVQQSKTGVKLDTVITGLNSPWGIAFLPDGDMLINERSGKMLRYRNNQKIAEIEGVPEVHTGGQAGLLDLRLHPDYQNNGWLYFAYVAQSSQGWNTAVMRAKLQDNTLVEKQLLYKCVPDLRSGIQFGCKITFDGQGHVFFGVGDNGDMDKAQELSNDCGKIFRLNEDGSVPADNPFVNTAGARPAIWSYGHRNPEGLVYDPVKGILWEHEHGPMGGDELNIIQKGKNYGWPVVTFGKNYDGSIISKLTTKPGIEPPVIHWTPSIAPCAMIVVNSTKYKGWEGNLLLGALKFMYLDRIQLSGTSVVRQEILYKNIGRVRNVEMDPQGYIYFATELPGTIYKLTPLP